MPKVPITGCCGEFVEALRGKAIKQREACGRMYWMAVEGFMGPDSGVPLDYPIHFCPFCGERIEGQSHP